MTSKQGFTCEHRTNEDNICVTITFGTKFETAVQEHGYMYAAESRQCGLSSKSFTRPLEWPLLRKVWTLSITSFGSFLAAFAAGSYAMVATSLQQEWSVSSKIINLPITLFVLGFSFAPIVLAPYSEIRGRYPVFVIAAVVFFCGSVGCGFSRTFTSMLVCRFLAGLGGSIYATLVGGIVGDLFVEQPRNIAMTLYSLCVMLGTAVGPLVSGLVNERFGWRWVFHLQTILIGGMAVVIITSLPESRENVVLEKKAKRFTKRYQDNIAAQELEDPKQTPSTVHETISRQVIFVPEIVDHRSTFATICFSFQFVFKLLVTEPVVFFFSLWISFAWAILYMQFGSIKLVFGTTFGFSEAQSGFVFTSVIVGSILSCAINLGIMTCVKDRGTQSEQQPEARLYVSCVESILLPAGLFLFGWTSTGNAPWIVPAVAVVLCTIGIFSIYLAVFMYFAEVYGQYASSALAAQSMCRNLLAGVFPLLTHQMFVNLGFQWAGTLLGCLGLVLTTIPWVLCIYGKRIRGRSAFASQMASKSLIA